MVFDINMFDTSNKIIVVESVGYESILKHSHNFVEIVCVRSGTAIHYVNNKEIKIKEGDMFVVGAAQHSIRPTCDEYGFKITNIVCDMSIFKGALPQPTDVFCDPDNCCFKYFEAIVSEATDIKNESQEIMALYAQNIINCMLIQKLASVRTINKGVESKKSITEYINSATSFMRENYAQKISLDDIAKAVCIYPAYLQKLFRENRSTGVIEYLIRYRMEKSGQYLIETDKTVEEISELVGIFDLKNFYVTFKKFFNSTPIQYRKTHGNNVNHEAQ